MFKYINVLLNSFHLKHLISSKKKRQHLKEDSEKHRGKDTAEDIWSVKLG